MIVISKISEYGGRPRLPCPPAPTAQKLAPQLAKLASLTVELSPPSSPLEITVEGNDD